MTEKYLLAVYDLSIDKVEDNCIQDVVIINNKNEAIEEFNKYCNVKVDDDMNLSNNMRIVLAKVTHCMDIKIITKIKKTKVL